MSMLYKAPGPHYCDGHMVDYIVVPDSLDEDTIALGWFRTIPEALEAAQSVDVQSPAAPEAQAPKRRGRPPKVAQDVDQA